MEVVKKRQSRRRVIVLKPTSMLPSSKYTAILLVALLSNVTRHRFLFSYNDVVDGNTEWIVGRRRFVKKFFKVYKMDVFEHDSLESILERIRTEHPTVLSKRVKENKWLVNHVINGVYWWREFLYRLLENLDKVLGFYVVKDTVSNKYRERAFNRFLSTLASIPHSVTGIDKFKTQCSMEEALEIISIVFKRMGKTISGNRLFRGFATGVITGKMDLYKTIWSRDTDNLIYLIWWCISSSVCYKDSFSVITTNDETQILDMRIFPLALLEPNKEADELIGILIQCIKDKGISAGIVLEHVKTNHSRPYLIIKHSDIDNISEEGYRELARTVIAEMDGIDPKSLTIQSIIKK